MLTTTSSAPLGERRRTDGPPAVTGATGACRDTCSSEVCRVPAVGTPPGNANATTSSTTRRSLSHAPCSTVAAGDFRRVAAAGGGGCTATAVALILRRDLDLRRVSGQQRWHHVFALSG